MRVKIVDFKLIDIPKLFQSYKDEKLFDHCISCNKYLLQDDTHYIIEKAIRNYPNLNSKDVIFEYAMCFDCVEKMRDEISEESMTNIDNYFNEKIDISQRYETTREYGTDVDKYVENCMVSGDSISTLNEYVIQAHCISDKLALSFFPYMISEKVMDDIANLLSNKTLDFLNGFMDNHFGYPPEFNDILTRRLILI